MKKKFHNSTDLIQKVFHIKGQAIVVQFVSYLVDRERLEREILNALTSSPKRWTNDTLMNKIPIAASECVSSVDQITQKCCTEVYPFISKGKRKP